jgi:ankyrin repeat protein
MSRNLEGAKGKEAIYGWEKQVRDENAEIKRILDKQWSERQQKRRADELNKKLREAAKAGDAETVRALIEVGVTVNEVSKTFSNSPLHYACREGRTEAALALIAAKADVNARNSDARSPLHWAASNGTASVVRALVESGADLYAKNMDGQIPLDVANFWNNPETAPILRQLMGFSRRVGVKCEGFQNGVQEHFSVQRVGVYPNTKGWR